MTELLPHLDAIRRREAQLADLRASWDQLVKRRATLGLGTLQDDTERIIQGLMDTHRVPLIHPLLLPLLALVRGVLEASGLYTLPNAEEVATALADPTRTAAMLERVRVCAQRISHMPPPMLSGRWITTPQASAASDFAAGQLARLRGTIRRWVDALFVSFDRHLPKSDTQATFRTAPLTMLEDPVEWLSELVITLCGEGGGPHPLLEGLAARVESNVRKGLRLPADKPMPLPAAVRERSPQALATLYFAGTPFAWFFAEPLSFGIPGGLRFEHVHIVAGSGHGKTQCLEALILRDLERAKKERQFGFAVIDNQGDLIRRISQLAVFDPVEPGSLASRLVMVDPAYPIGLNLFDLQLERLAGKSAKEQLAARNGVVELYRYIFGELFRAELTQKQAVVFTFLAKLLFVLPDPTVHTLKEAIEHPHRFAEYFGMLDAVSQDFFDHHFFQKTFEPTRVQILTRLFGLIGDPGLAPMLGHRRNTVDVYRVMQEGGILLINTAKSVLHTENSRLFGRFFIALIAQATQERAGITEEGARTPFHLYIDEAWEYADEKLTELINQARKYRVGITLAHQNLDQLSSEMRASLLASVGTKLVGGVNAHDATAFAREMHTSAEFIQATRKARDGRSTQFACHIRHHTDGALAVQLQFGALDALPRMDAAQHQLLLERGMLASVEEGRAVAVVKVPDVAGNTAVQDSSARPVDPVATQRALPDASASEPSTSRRRRRSL